MLEQKQIWIIVLLFFCQHAGLGEGTSKHSQACEGSSLALKCDHGFIHVDKANYGRTSSTVCSAGKPAKEISDVHCSQKTSLQKLSTRCNGKTSCSVPAQNSFFSDPCVGTYKYLDVSYSCVQSRKSVTCEGKQSHIHCDTGVIQIKHANYGRRDLTICKHAKATSATCYSNNTGHHLSRCNGKKKCSLHASNSVHGDPCHGVHKYLEVTYNCVAKKHHHDHHHAKHH
ncbi:L-rhamnose-binding lectin CSL3-like [Paramisgurnus dabryanus]|uniref:L-rhamnose-binding lectin CSL3-like n=1 Tax=Paramisgurnus dabryanus TaxID=90735 RepID=UPI0031F390F1